MSKWPEYHIWQQMIVRCDKTTDDSYQRYGGRGITVCDRWRESFVNFISDVGRRPSPQHTIDRKDNDGNYEPGNCRWATQKEQCRNKATNRLLTYQGETLTIAEWAERYGVTHGALSSRLTAGWPPKLALTTPVGPIGTNQFSRGRNA